MDSYYYDGSSLSLARCPARFKRGTGNEKMVPGMAERRNPILGISFEEDFRAILIFDMRCSVLSPLTRFESRYVSGCAAGVMERVDPLSGYISEITL